MKTELSISETVSHAAEQLARQALLAEARRAAAGE
ncbi:hypothetical protein ANRL3_01677 [Anaerolineae bacterium]|nr:hypothetical protein ANRL3_01677 [Anaerolineae bacterium]